MPYKDRADTGREADRTKHVTGTTAHKCLEY